MSKPIKRRLVADALAEAEVDVTPSRDNVITLQTPEPTPKEGVRHGYRTTLYLPREAQYKLREIALMKRCKPHDVLVEAMADLFARYNAGDLADRLRKPSRDDVTA